MTGQYGLDEIGKLKLYIVSDSRVLIVGAHVGILVIPISKLGKAVAAVEATPTTNEL